MDKKAILALLCFAVAMIGILSPVNASVELINSEDKVYTIASKEKITKLKLTWNGNGGKMGARKTVTTIVTKGKKIGKLPSTPKRSGYTFNGWFTKKNGGKKINVNTIPKGKVTYFAQWKVNTYTLTLDDNGGTVNPKSKKIVFNKVIGTLPKPTRSDYTFLGWFTAKTGGKEVKSSHTMPNKNMTIYAQWKEDPIDVNAETKKLVGSWSVPGGFSYTFHDNGKFSGDLRLAIPSPHVDIKTITGDYKVLTENERINKDYRNQIRITNRVLNDNGNISNLPDIDMAYRFGDYLYIGWVFDTTAQFKDPDRTLMK